MVKIEVPYGKASQTAMIDDGIDILVIDPPRVPVTKTSEIMLRECMDSPIGSDRLEHLVRAEDTVAIVVNDHTRPGPSKLIVKEVLARLKKAGVPDERITFIFATGSHRAPTMEEQREILGAEVVDGFRRVSHDCKDKNSISFLGNSSQGAPIYLNKAVTESSFVITTGLIAPHQSAGFSGGRKSIVPGVAGIETLKIHHSLPIRPFEPSMGFYEGNPFHEMALEIARKVNVRFIVNSVNDSHKQDIAFVAGDLEAAHKEGTRICREASQVDIDQLADIVVVSPGGSPRDSNLYQSQKALSVGELLGKAGCTYILVAECANGYGEGVFCKWMEEAKTPQEVLERFKAEGFDVGSNKAFLYARALCKGRVIIVSDRLESEKLSSMMLEHALSLEQAIEMASRMGEAKRMIVLPQAVNIIPRVTGR